MKEAQAAPERIIVIDIKLNRGLVLGVAIVLVAAVLLGFLTLTGGNASASAMETAETASTGMRRFYETPTITIADYATSACAPGYHMASLWEIADPSNLEYNTELGLLRTDSGQGPPTDRYGWVRTGYIAEDANVPGQANCEAWTSSDPADWGTRAGLHLNWDSGTQDIGVWGVDTQPCSGYRYVWCVED